MVKVSADYDIDAVRSEWIGRSSEVIPGRYPVEYDAIRRHCHMVEDRNPLYLDPEFASNTRYGAVIAPPVMVDYFAGQGLWPPSTGAPRMMQHIPTRGDRAINLNQSMEFIRPARVGDHLSAQSVVEDIYEKSIRLDPKAVWIVVANRITNQDGELVAIVRNTLLLHRSPEEVAADTDGTAEGPESA